MRCRCGGEPSADRCDPRGIYPAGDRWCLRRDRFELVEDSDHVLDPFAPEERPARRFGRETRHFRIGVGRLDYRKALFGQDVRQRAVAVLRGNVEGRSGIGALYRRFPKRADLIAAVFRREVDACAAEAPVLAAKHRPGEALAHWLKRYAAFLGTKKGLAAALHSGDPAFDALPAYFRARFEPVLAALLDAAAAAGEARGDVEPYDLLRAIGNLWPPRARTAKRMWRACWTC